MRLLQCVPKHKHTLNTFDQHAIIFYNTSSPSVTRHIVSNISGWLLRLLLLFPPLFHPSAARARAPAIQRITYHTLAQTFLHSNYSVQHTHSTTSQPTNTHAADTNTQSASEQAVVPSYFMRPTFAPRALRTPHRACDAAPQGFGLIRVSRGFSVFGMRDMR